jgi:hypothetical protein
MTAVRARAATPGTVSRSDIGLTSLVKARGGGPMVMALVQADKAGMQVKAAGRVDSMAVYLAGSQKSLHRLEL